ncbi:Vanw family protein [Tumidithrix helvetica PCC 7403]|uniref:VanW family protein n=1 Tax=Tumidithrix helvetica TaxID=3457545 RepID=UPI003C883C00
MTTVLNRSADRGIKHPNFYSEYLFRLKASFLQLNRGIRNFIDPPKLYPKNYFPSARDPIATSITPLWNYSLRDREREAESELQLGKIHNLRIAAQTVHGVEIPKDGIFSFWAYVGQPTRSKGYVKGREIRQGCTIPSIGGGLCQLSNALYSVALDAGFEILERHAHTQIVPGSLAEIGRDATVFWNYVDLRFKVNRAIKLEISLTGDALVVQVQGIGKENQFISVPLFNAKNSSLTAPDFTNADDRPVIDRTHDCLSCNVSSCHRNMPQSSDGKHSEYEAFPKKIGNRPNPKLGKTAYLLDEYWIEFDRYIQTQKNSQDILVIPLDGKRFRKPNYAWSQSGFAQVNRATFLTLTRALATRNLSPQGQSLQNTLLKYDRKLAEYFSSLLAYKIAHIVVSQNLLPFLWQNGSLQGRTFDVLMTRSPLAVLQEQLDFAHRLHPDSPTLNDFRLSTEFTQLETHALAQARYLITPHTEIAALFPQKAHLLDWHIPEIKPNLAKGNRILFPASAIGRKGAYEIREVAKKLNLELTVLGRNLESEDFWEGITIHKPLPNCLEEVGLVVLPAFVEHKPRILLNAIAHKIPVIASSACGLGSLEGVTKIPSGDMEGLANAMMNELC